MRVVAQRVARASVTVDGARVAKIGLGFLLLVGIGASDADEEVDRLAEKIACLRVFAKWILADCQQDGRAPAG